MEKDSVAMVDDIIGSLKSLPVSKKDKWKVKDAIEHMERVERRTVDTAKGIQWNIDDTMEAIDSLLFYNECGYFRDQVNDGCVFGSLPGKTDFGFFLLS